METVRRQAVDPLDAIEFDPVVGKRAMYEHMELRPSAGEIVVRNMSQADPDEHTYRVMLEDGLPASCSCPDYQYRRADEGTACKHIVRCAMAEPVLDAATARR